MSILPSLSPDAAKLISKEIYKSLKKSGTEVSLSHMQEAVAHAWGARNFDTLCGQARQQKNIEENPILKPSKAAGKLPTSDDLKMWVDENILLVADTIFDPPQGGAQLIQNLRERTSRQLERQKKDIREMIANPALLLKYPYEFYLLAFDSLPRVDEKVDCKAFAQKLQECLPDMEAWSDLGAPPPFGKIRIVDKIWDSPLRSTSKRAEKPVAFFDLKVDLEIPTKLRVSNANDFSGYFSRKPQWEIITEQATLLVDVRPKIDSIGKIIRHINTCRDHAHESIFVVVSPDDHGAAIFQENDIHFYKYQSEGI